MAVLPDVIVQDLDVVFCGTAAGRKSAEVRAYYAGPGNKFWATLHATGLTPHRIAPTDYHKVLSFRLGLTDLAKRVSGADSTLKQKDFGAEALRNLIQTYSPKYVAFTSKRAAQEFFCANGAGFGIIGILKTVPPAQLPFDCAVRPGFLSDIKGADLYGS